MDIKRLFLAHGRELQRYLTRRLRDAETAADLTQETFLRLAEAGGAAEGGAAVLHQRSYLYRMAHNLAVDHLRRQGRERTDPTEGEVLDAVMDEAPCPERSAMGRGELRHVREALLELPERTRQVFALVRVEGLTYRETAQRLGISDSSVQKHLAKAVKHVMQRLR